MDTGDLVVRIVQAVAWPLAIIIIVFILRGPIGQAILTLSRLRYKDLEVEFNKALKDAESKAEELELPSPEDMRSVSEPAVSTSPYNALLEMARRYPRAAITEAWRTVELSALEAANAQGIEVRGPKARRDAIHNLAERTQLGESTLHLYEKLRKIRNEAAHSVGFEVDPEEAVRYVDLALGLARRLQILDNE